MILGVGIDLLNTDRIEKLYKKFGDKLLYRILSNTEIDFLKESKKNIFNFLSKRFCVKEAFSKAIGTGIGGYISFKDISCINDKNGKPYVICNENLINFIEEKFFIKFDKINIDISISDDKPFVNAIVIISKKG